MCGAPSYFLAAMMLLAGTVTAPMDARADSNEKPEITAQGFDIADVQEGLLGGFGRLRVRIEAPERIEALSIEERSYEVDLATTLDQSNYGRFGIDKRIKNRQDVTLNFTNYINEKLDSEGSYDFQIRVTDKQGRSAEATLLVKVLREQTVAQDTDRDVSPVQSRDFSFKRIGPGGVAGAEDFGLTWRTIESAEVVIEMTGTASQPMKLVKLRAADYDGITTREHLGASTKLAEPVERIVLTAANNKAAGHVFAVVGQDETLVFKIKESATTLGEQGTTVSLAGELKH